MASTTILQAGPLILRGLWLGIVILCAGCDSNTVAQDQAYADQLVATEFQPPLTYQEVRRVLARHDSDAVLQKGCGLIPQRGLKSCVYSSVALIALPNNNWWRGQGDLQIYLVFDEAEQLVSVDYDLAYPNGQKAPPGIRTTTLSAVSASPAPQTALSASPSLPDARRGATAPETPPAD